MENPSPNPDSVGRSPLLARLILTTLALLGILLVSLVGATLIPLTPPPGVILRSIWNGLLGRINPQTAAGPELIGWGFRVPRVMLGAIVGGSLAMAGATFQGLLMNPLADPYLIGVSAGAAVGAALAILLGLSGALGGIGTGVLAFAAGLATIFVVYRLAMRNGRVSLEAFLLAGVVVGSFMWAGVTVIMSIARPNDLQAVVAWLMGHLYDPPTPLVMWLILAAIVAASIGIYSYARDLNLLALGEEPAKQLGVEVERLKKIIIVLGSLVTAAAVSVSGIIAFVGLIIPHIARRIVGPDHRILLPASALIGASFLVWADALARGVISAEFPVGVITSLLGAPFFCYLLRRRPGGSG